MSGAGEAEELGHNGEDSPWWVQEGFRKKTTELNHENWEVQCKWKGESEGKSSHREQE